MLNITEETEASMSDEFIVNSDDTDSTWDTFETSKSEDDILVSGLILRIYMT
jgi:hypothetical protein